MAGEDPSQPTQPVPREAAPPAETVWKPEPEPQALAEAEAGVPVEWRVGDVLLDLYEVVAVLGEGGMGRVYEVRHKGWNVDLAVKSPKLEIFAKAGGKEDFVREAETWVNLGLHPHVVSCYYVRTLGGIPRVFAEYVEGGSLSDWIRSGRLYEGGLEKALARILDLAIQFAWGLKYAHEQGLVHQDVKPANVMMTADGVAKVTDFGLAKARGMAGDATTVALGQSPLVSVGGMTPAYCSPEQARGEKVSLKTDVWSWAVSVLEMFTGGVTWRAGQAALLALESYEEETTGNGAIPRMPGSVAGLLKRCFAGPEDRPSMGELAAVLREIREDRHAPSEPSAAELRADSLNNRALSYLDLGREDEARRAWEGALLADAQHPETTYNRGVVLWRRGELTDDVLARQLEAVRSSHGQRWLDDYLLALVHLERADADAAAGLLRDAARRDPEQAEVRTAAQLARTAPSVKTSAHGFPWDESLVMSAICASRDGRLVLSAGYPFDAEGEIESVLLLWEAATGRCVSRFEPQRGIVGSLCLSADGGLALSAHWKVVRLWQVSTGRCVRALEGHADTVEFVCMSDDSRLALSGDRGGAFRLWDLDRGRCLRAFDQGSLLRASASATAGFRFALSTADCDVLLWDLALGERVGVLEGHTGTVLSVAMTPDGRLGVSGGADRTLRIWDLTSGRCVRTLKGHGYDVDAVGLDAQGRRALSGSGDRTVRLWDIVTGRCLRTLHAEAETGVKWVSLSADGRTALATEASASGVRRWELPDRFPQVCPPRPSRPRSHAVQTETDARARELLDGAEKALGNQAYAVALSRLKDARALPGWERAPRSLNVWSDLSRCCLREGLRAAWLERTLEGHGDRVNAVALSRDGAIAVSGSQDNSLRVWDVATGACLRRITATRWGWVWSLCLGRDGRSVLSGSQDGILRLWEVATGRCLQTLEGHEETLVLSVRLSHDGLFALSADIGGTLCLWEVGTGRCLRKETAGSPVAANAACWSGDDRWVLSFGGEGTVRLWETASRRCAFEGVIESNGPRGYDLSPDARRALWGTARGLELWDLAAGRCLRVFEVGQEVNAMSMTPDGRFAIVGDFDGRLWFWDVATGRCMLTLRGHDHAVSALCLSGDGSRLLSGSTDATIRLWRLDWELEAHEESDRPEDFGPHLEVFLARQTPRSAHLPQDREPSEDEVRLALSRRGRPAWTEDEFGELLRELQWAGFGWAHPESVRKELERMALEWKGPLSPFGA